MNRLTFTGAGTAWSTSGDEVTITVDSPWKTWTGLNATQVRWDDTNGAYGQYSLVWGQSNTVSWFRSSIVWWLSNTIPLASNYSFIGGWDSNRITSMYSSIVGWYGNTIWWEYSFIGGGHSNVLTGINSFIGAGTGNNSVWNYSFIGAGQINIATGSTSFVGAWSENIASGLGSFIGAGASNIAMWNQSFVGGGSSNHAEGLSSSIPGGILNTASGAQSFAAGKNAKAYHDDSFVWSSTGWAFETTASWQFLVYAYGGVGINTNSNTGYTLKVGNQWDGSEAIANSWLSWSDIRFKKDFSLIPNAIEKIQQLNGYYFYWKVGANTWRQAWFVAQELEKVLPEVVNTDKEWYKSVEYGKVSALLVEWIKEQQNQIDTLRIWSKEQQDKIDILTAWYQEQQSQIDALTKEIVILKSLNTKKK